MNKETEAQYYFENAMSLGDATVVFREQTINIQEKYCDLLKKKAKRCYAQLQFEQAVLCFQKILSSDKNHWESDLSIQICYAKCLRKINGTTKENLEKAIKILKSALSPGEKNNEIESEIGLSILHWRMLNKNTGEAQCNALYEEAEYYFKRLPNEFDATRFLIASLISRKKWRKRKGYVKTH